MKPPTYSLLVVLGLIGSPFNLHAQLLDDVESAAMLTLQCVLSSGSGDGDYTEYGGKLAKTLSKLSSEEQERVFGYLPDPLGLLPVSGVKDAVSGTLDTAGSALTSGSATVPDSPISPIIDAIGKLNDTLFGVEPTATPIIGGVDPADPVMDPTDPVTLPAEPSTDPLIAVAVGVTAPTTLDEGLDGLVSWLANGGEDATEEEMAAKIDVVIEQGLLDPQGKTGTEILEALTTFSGKFSPAKGNSGLGGGPETAEGLNKLGKMLDWAIKAK